MITLYRTIKMDRSKAPPKIKNKIVVNGISLIVATLLKSVSIIPNPKRTSIG